MGLNRDHTASRSSRRDVSARTLLSRITWATFGQNWAGTRADSETEIESEARESGCDYFVRETVQNVNREELQICDVQ